MTENDVLEPQRADQHPVGETADRRTTRMRTLWRFMRPKAGLLALALLLGLLVSGVELASPMVTRWVLDSLSTPQSLIAPVSVLLALLVVSAVVGWRQAVILGTLSEGIVFDARESMITRYLRAKVLPLTRRSPGEWVTRVTSDSLLLREAASSGVIGIINGSVLLIGTLALMIVLDPLLTAITVGVVIVVGVVIGILMPAIAVAQERSQAALSDLGGDLEGTLRAIKTVKVANAEDSRRLSLLSHAARSREHGIRVVRREALVWTITGIGIQAAIIAVLGIGAWRVSIDAISVSTLVAFLLYAFGLLGPVTALATHVTTLQAGMAAAGRINEIDEMETEDRLPARSGTGTTPSEHPEGPAIELRSVTAAYGPGRTPAVRDLSLIVPRIGHTAIVGPSGAGKTTVMSLILRFLEPQSGGLTLMGRPYEQLTSAEVRDRITYVEQESPLLPGSLRQNLDVEGAGHSDERMSAVLDRLLLGSFLAELPDGLDTELRDTSISGGQRQRIAIARALLADPQILLLDEATAQVDGISERAIHDAIRQQAATGSVITIAHRLSTVVDADRILTMEGGRIAAQGTHRGLLETSPLYRSLVTSFAVPVPGMADPS